MTATGVTKDNCPWEHARRWKHGRDELVTSSVVKVDRSRVLKVIGRCIGSLFAWPYLLIYRLDKCILGPRRAFTGGSERVARIPGLLGVYIRQAFYRRTMNHVGSDVYFGFMSVFSKPEVYLGDRVYIGRFCSIGWARLDSDVMLADGVQILSGRHQHGGGEVQIGPDEPVRYEPVHIGSGSWLGANAVVMADVGSQSIIGAGAVVVRPVPDCVRAVGVPAKCLE